jgi:aromatic ring-opening dioxygenase catalytic subunit (LigB family)
LLKEWDEDKAEDVYKLYSRYKTFTDYLNFPKKSLHYEAKGDKEWADRTAEHYGIEIEGEDKR